MGCILRSPTVVVGASESLKEDGRGVQGSGMQGGGGGGDKPSGRGRGNERQKIWGEGGMVPESPTATLLLQAGELVDRLPSKEAAMLTASLVHGDSAIAGEQERDCLLSIIQRTYALGLHSRRHPI